MIDPDPPPAAPVPQEPALAAGPDAAMCRRWWIEVGVVICLGVLPDFWNALSGRLAGAPGIDQSFGMGGPVMLFAALVARSVGIVPVVLYIIWRSEQPWAVFGFKRLRWFDPLLGLGIYAGFYAVWYAFWIVAWALGLSEALGVSSESALHSVPSTDAVGAGGLFIIALGAICNGAAEEIVLFGFLFPRIRQLKGPVAAAIIVPLLFTSYHVYYDLPGIISVLLIGCVHTAAYLALRRIWPLIVSHAIGDAAWLLWA